MTWLFPPGAPLAQGVQGDPVDVVGRFGDGAIGIGAHPLAKARLAGFESVSEFEDRQVFILLPPLDQLGHRQLGARGEFVG